MTWIMPTVTLPTGGTVRSVGSFNRKAYDRAYYHAKRKPRKQVYTPAQAERRNVQRLATYYRNLEQARADARVRYWKNRDKYAATAKLRARARRAKK